MKVIAIVLLVALCPLAVPIPAAAQPGRAGWEALQKGDAERAAAVFRQALELRPRDATLHFGAGLAAHLLGRDDRAVSALRRAVDLEPNFIDAAVLLGQLAYGQGDIDLAIRSFKRALALAPTHAGIREQLEAWEKEAALHDSFEEQPGMRFRLLFEGPEQHAIASHVSSVLETAYWSLGAALDQYPTETITVILYTGEQFRDVTRSPAWAGGAYDGRIRLAVKDALKTPRDLDRVVVHELAHAVIATLAPRGVPVWLNEGLATALEPGGMTWVMEMLRGASSLVPLDELERGFSTLSGRDALLAYAQSGLAAQILIERLGPSLGMFLQALGNGYTVEMALSRFGVTLEDVEAEWVRRLGAN